MDKKLTPFIARVGLPALAARNHYDEGGAEHLRLALILLDGSAEALLRRMVDDVQMWFTLGNRSREINLELLKAGETTRSLPLYTMTFPSTTVGALDRSMPVYLSKRQRDKLHSEFGPNVDVALYFRHVNLNEARALRHLHEYRNGAYHRDELNEESIRAFVELYLDLVARLMRSVKPLLVRLYPPEDLKSVRTLLGLDELYDVSLSGVAEAMCAGLSTSRIEILSNNLGFRLIQVARRIHELWEDLGVPGLTTSDVARLVQFDQPWPDDMDVIRGAKLPVTEMVLSSWAEKAADLSAESDTLRRFLAFASIDVPLGAFERQLEVVELQLDRETQLFIDELRGK
jgi:hypothetical protein